MCIMWLSVGVTLILPTWPVGSSHDEDLSPRLKPVHLCQQLVDNTHAGARLRTHMEHYVDITMSLLMQTSRFLCAGSR